MSVPATAVPDAATGSAWLAAFALGLAYSQRPDHERVCELREAAAGRPWLLGEARQRLVGRVVAEPAICDEAVRLLVRAQAAAPMAC